MSDQAWLAEQFNASREHLCAVAYRMLGSRTEAEDAVQEAWLRLSRSDAASIDNLGGWLTTVVARVCLDQLRARKSRPEESFGERTSTVSDDRRRDAEQEAMLADSVGLALLVVLRKLGPAERVAFVLHDMFDLPFEEIAEIVGKSPEATRQLASRARRRVRGGHEEVDDDLVRRREMVDAFLAASRNGDMEALLRMLDPDVVFRVDAVAARMGSARETRGKHEVAKLFAGRAAIAHTALVDGEVGVVVAPAGKLVLLMRVRMDGDRIVAFDVVADPAKLAAIDVSVV
jgi:RNA polymerase sigma-70 factor (ECF subfamily)